MNFIKTFENYSETILSENKMTPKSNLNVGDFLLSYYHGKNRGITSCYRIVKVNHSDYTVMNIQSSAGQEDIPLAVDDSEIIGTESFKKDEDNEYCFETISTDTVKSMTIDIEKDDAIDYIMKTSHSISGVEKGKEKEYWENSKPNKIAINFARDINEGISTLDNFKIVRLLENGIVIYDPYDNFRAWGHSKVNF